MTNEKRTLRNLTHAPVKTKVLIVDDDAAQRWMLKEALQMWGYATVEAATSAQALLTAVETQPALILLDIHLPDGSGLEVLRQLKVRLPRAAILMLTGEAIYENAVSALRGGAVDFLSKPLKLDELEQALARVGVGQRQPVPMPAPVAETPRVLILCDTAERIPPLQTLFSKYEVDVTSVLFPEEWEYVAGNHYELALVSVTPDLLEPALKNLRARDEQATLPILVELDDLVAPAQLAGLLSQYRAMPCGHEEIVRLAQGRFAVSPPRGGTANVL